MEANWSQTLPDWIAAHVNALSFLGGVPRQIVSDNLVMLENEYEEIVKANAA